MSRLVVVLASVGAAEPGDFFGVTRADGDRVVVVRLGGAHR